MKIDAVERKVSIREQVAVEKEEWSKRKRNLLSDINTLWFPLVQEQEESEGALPKDTDKSLAQRFKAFELTLKAVQSVLAHWDRKQGVLLQRAGAEDAGHEEGADQRQVPSAGRRGRKERERERAERERLERERAERERLEKLRAQEERSDGGEGQEEDREGKKDLGVPFVSIQTPDPEGSSWKQALEHERLPKGEQVQTLLQDRDVPIR